MASTDQSSTDVRSPLSVRVGGFVAGVGLCLVLGAVVSVAYSGVGLGDFADPPRQVYTNF